MELGEKLLRARQEAGLSQRQLCGEEITRNMLSQIEHGTAHPSMATLRYLASQLGKPVSYFLDENAVTSPNLQLMADVRKAYDDGACAAAWEMLTCYQEPDPVFDREYRLLKVLLLLELAKTAIKEGRVPYARTLLEKARGAEKELAYPIPELSRRRLLLQGQLPEEELAAVCGELPGLDEELLLRAEEALQRKDHSWAADLLGAAQDREAPRWNLLRGQAYYLQKQYALAVDCLQKAENAAPKICWPLLENCYRELGDFQKAYHYACKQR